MDTVLGPILDAVAAVLAGCYALVPNYAVAIVMLTIAIYVVLTPLTLKGTRSMMAMQQFQPEMRRLQQQHKGDRQKLNEEMLKFYQEHQINPIGGCLPLLAQLPVFLVLFRVIRGLTNTATVDGRVVGDPSYLDEGTRLYHDLRDSAGEMIAFGVDLDLSANDAFQRGIIDVFPYALLTAVYLGVIFVQQRQMQARRANAPAPTGPMAQAQTQKIMQYLPFFFVIFSVFFPAALVIYFIVGAVSRIGQQAYIRRTSPDLNGGPAASTERSAAAEGTPRKSRSPDRSPSTGDTGNGDRPRSSQSRSSKQQPAHPRSRRSGKRKRKR